VEAGHKLAVLAVDPSSNRSGGSILGDKTRMADLGRRPEVFIRPSPSGGTLGGVARRTREAILLCEAAGFDLVLVETVGVGQSEVAVADLVDLFVLVAAPAGGDELQGIKRGIMELADVIVVNKADGDLLPAANRAAADLRRAVHLLRPKREGWEVEVLLASAIESTGIAEMWDHLIAGAERLRASGAFDATRADQAVSWMWSEVRDGLLDAFLADAEVQAELRESEAQIRAGERSPTSAALSLLQRLRRA
jgi:LAO/AO transport system kinase